MRSELGGVGQGIDLLVVGVDDLVVGGQDDGAGALQALVVEGLGAGGEPVAGQGGAVDAGVHRAAEGLLVGKNLRDFGTFQNESPLIRFAVSFSISAFA